ncbi:MAG: hypothetical protein ACRETD_08510 [Steroidobacteraceae bacterium]
MTRVFVSEGTGAAVYVFSNDHCPPHVSARHRGEEWIARVRFSYLRDTVQLWSIEPHRHAPAQRVINRLLEEVHGQLPACRRSWWHTQHTLCLENQWVLQAADGSIQPLEERIAEAKQIAQAVYLQEPGAERLWLQFSDGTITEVRVTP